MSADPAIYPAEAKLWPLFAALVAALFVVYNLNFREIGLLDPVPATLLPASLLLEGNADLDEFRRMLRKYPYGRGTRHYGTLQEREGHLVSSYPIGAALIALPVYAVPVWLGWLEEPSDYRLVGKLAASLMVALSAGLLFLAGCEVSRPGPALLAALVYGLGTNAWTVASQALWQHGPGMLCLAFALYWLLRLERGGGAASAAAAGAALGLAVTCRSLNVIPAAALGLYVLVHHRRYLLAFALPLAAAGAWQAWYNLSTFGDLRGGYDAIYQSAWHRWQGLHQGNVLSNPFWSGLAGILLSPNKGLLVYTPVMAIGFAALCASCTARSFRLGRYLALWVGAIVVLLSKNILWWGGSTFGPRYLCEAMTALTLTLAWFLPRILSRPFWRAAFATTAALGVGVQIVGAFFTPCHWHDKPLQVDRHPSRLWDWRDPQLLRCLEKGPRALEFLHLESDPEP